MTAARKPMDALEDALIDAAGSAFLVDQFVTHGEHTDDAERALHHVNRLLAADMKALRKAFDAALQADFDLKKGRKPKVRKPKPSGAVVVPIRPPPENAA